VNSLAELFSIFREQFIGMTDRTAFGYVKPFVFGRAPDG